MGGETVLRSTQDKKLWRDMIALSVGIWYTEEEYKKPKRIINIENWTDLMAGNFGKPMQKYIYCIIWVSDIFKIQE